MNLPKTDKPYKKRACLLRIDGVIRVFTFSRPKFHRVQCKIEDPFSAGCLAPIPMTAFKFVDIIDLRMRINLQHPGCFRLAAIGVKRFFFIECLTPHSARAILLTASRIVQACWYGWALQTFQISA